MNLDQDIVMKYVLDKYEDWGIEEPFVCKSTSFVNGVYITSYTPFIKSYMIRGVSDLKEVLECIDREPPPQNVLDELKRQIGEMNMIDLIHQMIDYCKRNGESLEDDFEYLSYLIRRYGPVERKEEDQNFIYSLINILNEIVL